jgi:hypothetical protein
MKTGSQGQEQIVFCLPGHDRLCEKGVLVEGVLHPLPPKGPAPLDCTSLKIG